MIGENYAQRGILGMLWQAHVMSVPHWLGSSAKTYLLGGSASPSAKKTTFWAPTILSTAEISRSLLVPWSLV